MTERLYTTHPDVYDALYSVDKDYDAEVEFIIDRFEAESQTNSSLKIFAPRAVDNCRFLLLWRKTQLGESRLYGYPEISINSGGRSYHSDVVGSSRREPQEEHIPRQTRREAPSFPVR